MHLAGTSVFLDFDGTISVVDVSDHLAERLAGRGWRAIDAAVRAGAIGSREWLLGVWDLLPHDEVTLRRAAAEIDLDPGFEPLVVALRAAGAEIAVVSDGFGFYVEDACAPLGLDVLTNRPDFTTARLDFPHEDRCCPCATCGVCKQAPLKDARSAGRTTVLVGDGTSDIKAALLADVVFAKGELARWCDRNDVDHQRFDTLADVQRALCP